MNNRQKHLLSGEREFAKNNISRGPWGEHESSPIEPNWYLRFFDEAWY